MGWTRIDPLEKALVSRIQHAAQAVDDTTAAAVIYAKQNHPGWKNRTGAAEGSIRMEPAKVEGGVIRGAFGSFDISYFIWLEIGANGHRGDATLRRAADAEFPRLGERLRRRLT